MKTAQQHLKPANIKVFFDGECPLCRREIDHYRGMRGAENIDWLDITASESNTADYGITLQQAMARIHVLDAQGQWQTGAYGFVEMWNQLTAMRWLATLLKTLHLVATADWIYSKFARWRLQKRCDNNACKTEQR